MPEQAQASTQVKVEAAKVRRTGENRYPNYDLNSCVVLAKKVKDDGGNDCTVEQLGGLLGYRNTNGGGFSTRVANAKMFGLIETVQGRYRITPRAETILYPSTEAERQQALSDAFLSVPMYKRVYEMHKSQRLPEALGMQNLLHRQFLIPIGDATQLALRVLLDSAEQAGFFKATQGKRTNLILPILPSSDQSRDTAPLTPEVKHTNGGGNDGGGGGGAGGIGRGKLVDGVLELLPPEEAWDEPLMRDWLKMLELALRVRYKLPTT